ncbi:MAG TPA: filamentous hemagglutinin N-terminal domain-containing protein, partial [Leptolyngbyaceae cyanobacterium]
MTHPFTKQYIATTQAHLLATVISLGVQPAILQPAIAQITPDSTLGQEGSQITAPADVSGEPAILIEGGAPRGPYLFHSFLDFNVGELEQVYFANPAGIVDIFSRVTGNTASTILGALGVDGSANLWLLNPNGIIFGPNAQLDIAGSFTATTADRLLFENGFTFGAVDPDLPPMLQINTTVGLQYGSQPALITNQSRLQAGQNLMLGAHRLDLAGELVAGRDVVLQGAERQLSTAAYTVGGYLFTQDLTGAGVDFLIPHEQVIIASGNVQLDENYTGQSLYVLAGGQVSQANGVNNIIVTGTTGSSVTASVADGVGGTQLITVAALNEPTVDIRSGVDWTALTGTVPQNSNSSSLAVTFDDATGQGITLGNITNNGGEIRLIAQGDIATGVLGSESINGQDGGAVTLIAGNTITTGDIFSFSTATSNLRDVTGGNGGSITLLAKGNISTGSVFSDSTSDSTFGDITGGRGGDITLVSGDDITTSFLSSFSNATSVSGDVVDGDGGDITLIAGDAIATNALTSTSTLDSTLGAVVGGRGGDITVTAGEGITTQGVFSASTSIS